MMEQTPGMKGFTELATWSFLQPGNGQKANIPLLKEAVNDLCQMTTQKSAGQKSPLSGEKYNNKDLSVAENLERVKFTIICEAVLLVLSGKLDGLEEDSMTLADNIRSFDDETLAQLLTKMVSNAVKASVLAH